MLKSFSTTGIGSLPHTDSVKACKTIFSSVEIPFWPQLPHRSFHELMVPQYSEGFPFTEIKGEDIQVRKAQEHVISSFYEAIEAQQGFQISKDFAEGLYTFIDILKQEKQKREMVKGHITGPLTFTLSITDDQKKPIYFNEEMRELSLELLKGKTTWQINTIRPYADEVLLFIDEPILSALGTSTYIGVDSAVVSRLLTELVRHARNAGALVGIHCCSKADWSLVLTSEPDVLSFDAYFYWDTLGIYPDAVRSFVDRGGFIAWGIVPTTETVRTVTLEDLREHLERGLSSLEKLGLPEEKIRKQSLLTPSCGTGSLSVHDASRVFTLLKELRERYAKV